MAQIFDKRKQLAIAPDAALLDGRVLHAPLAERSFQFLGSGQSAMINRLKQRSTLRTVVDDFRDRKPRATS